MPGLGVLQGRGLINRGAGSESSECALYPRERRESDAKAISPIGRFVAHCRLMHAAIADSCTQQEQRYSTRNSSQIPLASHVAFCRLRDMCDSNATLAEFLHSVMRRNRLCAPNVEWAGGLADSECRHEYQQ